MFVLMRIIKCLATMVIYPQL